MLVWALPKSANKILTVGLGWVGLGLLFHPLRNRGSQRLSFSSFKIGFEMRKTNSVGRLEVLFSSIDVFPIMFTIEPRMVWP